MTATMATNFQSQGEGRSPLYAATGVMINVSPEARWLVERLGDGEVLVSG